jgi:DNA-binding NarL/FixJ family response regulator
MSGIAATSEIKKINPSVRIIVVTAAVQEKYRELVSKAGADSYITKPYTEEELIQAIEGD